MQITLIDLINYLSVFSIFTDAFTYFRYVRLPLVIMAMVLMVLVVKTKKMPFNKPFLYIFGIACLVTVINIFLGNASFFRFFLQLIGVFFSAFAFYVLIRANNNNAQKLFKVYMDMAFLICLLGIFQQLSYLIGFKPGYDYSWLHPDLFFHESKTGLLRIDTIALEPTDLAFLLMPAFFASFMSFFKGSYNFIKKWKALIIIMVFFLTFSTTGYIGILFSLALILINFRKFSYLISTFLLIALFVSFAYNSVGDVKFRVDTFISIYRGEVKLGWLQEGSSFSLLSNAAVSLLSFRDSPLFGFGLGSYDISYLRYIKGIFDPDSPKATMEISKYRVNYNDAASLFFRLLSETGLFGVLAFFIFIKRCYLPKTKDPSNFLWIINNAVLCLFLIRFIRGGHYFYGGFFLFFWLYYFSKLNSQELKAREA